MNGLLRLREQHKDARPLVGRQLIMLFLRAVGNGKSIAVLIVCRFTIHQHHVMMRPPARDVMQRRMPCIQNAVSRQWHALPVRKGSNNFHCTGFFRLSFREAPPKNF